MLHRLVAIVCSLFETAPQRRSLSCSCRTHGRICFIDLDVLHVRRNTLARRSATAGATEVGQLPERSGVGNVLGVGNDEEPCQRRAVGAEGLRALTDQPATAFAEHLAARRGVVADDHRAWFAECLRIGEAQSSQFVRLASERKPGDACAAGLSALAAFRAAIHLVGDDEPGYGDAMRRLRVCARELLRLAELRAECVTVRGADRAPLNVWFLPAPRTRRPAPVVICIGDERESLELLLSRVVPAVAGRGLALMLIEMSDLEDAPGLRQAGLVTAEMRFADCVDELASRSEVDAGRIAVWGEGIAGALATRLAIADERVRAAVCDGGLWDALRIRANVAWLAASDVPASRSADVARRLRLARRLRCPFLVVASERNVASIEDAVALHADCTRLGARMDLEVPQVSCAPCDMIAAVLRSEARIADWLRANLTASAHDAATSNASSLGKIGHGRS